jgi:hypothetical protein
MYAYTFMVKPLKLLPKDEVFQQSWPTQTSFQTDRIVNWCPSIGCHIDIGIVQLKWSEEILSRYRCAFNRSRALTLSQVFTSRPKLTAHVRATGSYGCAKKGGEVQE